MTERSRQLVLDLPVEPRLGPEDFLVSASNEDAYSRVEAWPDWPSPLLLLKGPSGSGKSHLGAIWAQRTEAATAAACAVAERIAELGAADTLLLEDLDKGPLDEAALFHLLNIAREKSASILFTSARDIEECGIGTLDLRSRLRLAPTVEMGPPDDALLRAVLVKLLLDRQLVVDTTLVDYAANRIERSFARAAEFVDELDRETLSRGRRFTRAIAADIIARMSELAD